jgi:Rrf2 family nitric oxide-sensitive transcriptional repressor
MAGALRANYGHMSSDSRLLRLPPSSRYAVTAALCLAELPAGAYHMVAEIAERTGLSASYLSKILQRLARRGVLDSRRGANGGYRLSRPAGGVSLSEIVAASHSEGAAPRPCLIEARGCDCSRPCSMHRFVARAEGALRRRLDRTTLA